MLAIAVNDIIWHELDNLLEIHHDRSIDTLAVVESRHSVESVALHRLVIGGYYVVDRLSPRLSRSLYEVPLCHHRHIDLCLFKAHSTL